MIDAMARVPVAINEPVLGYGPKSAERARLLAELARQSAEVVEIPMHVGGRDVATGRLVEVRAPHAHARLLARWHAGDASHVGRAIDAALAAHASWSSTPFEARAAIFLRAAELLATSWRMRLVAATMLGQSKTAHQAEIDAACELVDFLRFDVAFARKIHDEQPASAPGTWNLLDARPLEGFVLAVTPFNFTAIAGNLPAAPALMGNVVVWKPAAAAMLAAHHVLALLREAGLPDGVINLVAGDPAELVDAALASPALAGVHFTGSTAVFQRIWSNVGARIGAYATYPRLVGETGGKDFVFAHPSADVDALATALVRGAFEYQGQKCSAASRAYVPVSLWPAVRERVAAAIAEIRVGDVADLGNFMGAVIDRRSFERIARAIDAARADAACRVVAGGTVDDREGFFVAPTLVETSDPKHRLMCDEIFGPVLTVYPYADAAYDDALALCASTSPYGLTGAVFARDRAAIEAASSALRFSAGNFYVNDKPTGAVVGQQPFGGSRASGTNDKAGSVLNLWRWVSPRTVKETLAPPTSWRYPFLDAE